MIRLTFHSFCCFHQMLIVLIIKEKRFQFCIISTFRLKFLHNYGLDLMEHGVNRKLQNSARLLHWKILALYFYFRNLIVRAFQLCYNVWFISKFELIFPLTADLIFSNEVSTKRFTVAEEKLIYKSFIMFFG